MRLMFTHRASKSLWSALEKGAKYCSGNLGQSPAYLIDRGEGEKHHRFEESGDLDAISVGSSSVLISLNLCHLVLIQRLLDPESNAWKSFKNSATRPMMGWHHLAERDLQTPKAKARNRWKSPWWNLRQSLFLCQCRRY